MLDNNSYGKITSTLTNGTTDTKVTLSANSKGKIYNGQKLLLTYPDGSNPLILTAAGDSTTSDTVIDLVSFTLTLSYPSGSILSPLLYDLTNVITGGSSLENLYQGITTQYIYLKPSDFLTTSGTTFKMYSRDNGGSVQPSTYIRHTYVFAMFFTPSDYEVTAVDVYGANNRTFDLAEANHNADSVTNVQTSGTMNTTMTLSTAHEFAVGKYGIIKIYIGASSDEIYGARITIQAI